MKIVELFEKDINRDINGVIKVGQLEESVLKTELEEYVLTREVRLEFNRLFEHFVSSGSSDRIGVWISGFFGSGKSHFLKVLSYLLANRRVAGKSALEWFSPQVGTGDAVLQANLERACEPPAEVMLFNIDAEAAPDAKQQQSAILQVFQKVFDVHRGYFGRDPSIARFEAALDDLGRLEVFRTAYAQIAGQSWEQQRAAWMMNATKIRTALGDSGFDAATAEGIVAERARHQQGSIKDFALEVQRYLSTRPQTRVIFMVDEVGQFIGQNTGLMLNLQTVVEELGSHNPGRAWVMVTSQEDLDSLIGVEDGANRKRDFSKIQGRFLKPVSLSSKNADEVIQLRLLEKTAAARGALTKLYAESETLLANLIRFTAPMHLPGFTSSDEFTKAYPFIPYQFPLLQAVFTRARQMGASGKHLASGERSMLDAFKIASQALQQQPLGTLAPFHLFYEAIAGFLEGAVKRVIERASDNPALRPWDVDLLKTLFMVKYVSSFPGTVENLTTLSLTQIGEDRLLLSQRIASSLERLEGQTLISRNADRYSFLTDDEQDVSRQIKNTIVPLGSEHDKLQELIWDGVFTDKKYRPDRRHEFGFNRAVDGKHYGRSTEQLLLNVIPADSEWHAQAQQALTGSGGNAFEALIVLPRSGELLLELRGYLQTEQFLRTVNTSSASPQLKLVVESQRSLNSERSKRVTEALEAALQRSSVFVSKREVVNAGETGKTPFRVALEALVSDNFTKFQLVQSAFETDSQIDTALQKSLLDSPNSLARSEIKAWLERRSVASERVPIKELIEAFSRAPYGWSELDVLGVTAELLALGELELRVNSGDAKLEGGLSAKIRSKQGLEAYWLRVPRSVNPVSIAAARDLAREALGIPSPATDPKDLAGELKQRLSAQHSQTLSLLEQARNGLPFKADLERIGQTLMDTLQSSDTSGLLDAVAAQRDALEDNTVLLTRIERFFGTQLSKFNHAKVVVAQLEGDLANLSDATALAAVQQAKMILNASDPSRDLPRIEALLTPAVQAVQLERNRLRAEVTAQIDEATQQLAPIGADTSALSALRDEVQQLERLDTILARGSRVDALAAQQRRNAIAALTPEQKGIKQTTLKIRASIRDATELEAHLVDLRSRISAALEAGAVVHLE